MRQVFSSKQLGQHESKTRLPQKDGTWGPGGLLRAIFFQFLRERVVWRPFGLEGRGGGELATHAASMTIGSGRKSSYGAIFSIAPGYRAREFNSHTIATIGT